MTRASKWLDQGCNSRSRVGWPFRRSPEYCSNFKSDLEEGTPEEKSTFCRGCILCAFFGPCSQCRTATAAVEGRATAWPIAFAWFFPGSRSFSDYNQGEDAEPWRHRSYHRLRIEATRSLQEGKVNSGPSPFGSRNLQQLCGVAGSVPHSDMRLFVGKKYIGQSTLPWTSQLDTGQDDGRSGCRYRSRRDPNTNLGQTETVAEGGRLLRLNAHGRDRHHTCPARSMPTDQLRQSCGWRASAL